MATEKQVMFIERLISERDTRHLWDTVEYKTVQSGLGHELSSRQARRRPLLTLSTLKLF